MAQDYEPVEAAGALAAGIAALRKGDREQARRLLTATLHANAADARAWLWLSGAVTTPAEQRYCLERALACDPSLAPAQRGLTMLGAVKAQAPIEFAHEGTGEPENEEPRTENRRTGERGAENGELPTLALHPSALSPQPSALPPSLAIWTQPWAALQTAVAERSPWETGFLGALAGISAVLAWAAQRNLGDEARPAEIMGLAVLVGPVLGLMVLVLGGVLLRSSGRWLGGRAGAGAVRAALAWASTPLIVSLLLWLVQLIVLPEASFSAAPVGSVEAILALGCGVIHVCLAVWAGWLSLLGLAVAHTFSVPRAALSWVLGGCFVAVIAFAVGFGTATLIGLRGG